MKTLIHIGGLFPDRIGKSVYEHLEKLYPEGKGKHIFGAYGLPAEDDRVQKVVGYLTEINFAHEMYFERVYEPEDYDQAKYFRIWPEHDFGSVSKRNSSGDLILLECYLRGKEFGWDGRIAGLAVSNRIKNLMERTGLKHLKFRNAVIMADSQSSTLSPSHEAFWELLTDLILPPISPTSEQGFIYGAEFHYTESEMQSVGLFDLAQTHEYLGDDITLGRNWVASKAFCDFCLAKKLPIVWKPVRID